MTTLAHALMSCLRALEWAAAVAAVAFVLGFVLPVLARALWLYWRPPKD